jgi:hypothetical protein
LGKQKERIEDLREVLRGITNKNYPHKIAAKFSPVHQHAVRQHSLKQGRRVMSATNISTYVITVLPNYDVTVRRSTESHVVGIRNENRRTRPEATILIF